MRLVLLPIAPLLLCLGSTACSGEGTDSQSVGAGSASTVGGAAGATATAAGTTGGANAATGSSSSGSSSSGGIGGAQSNSLQALHVVGPQLLNEANSPVTLRGVSTIDVGSPYNFDGITAALNQETLAIDLVTAAGWNTQIIRLPVYGSGSTRAGEPNNFPETGTDAEKDLWFAFVLKPVVDYATSKQLYVIVDWHEIASPVDRDEATKGFWTYLAPKFKDQTNVLYEVFNEDSDTNDWTAFQPYAQGWVDIIRATGANNVVLVGGPMWAQTIGGSATTPVTGGNVAYVAHAYCSHFNDSWAKGHIETQIAQAAAAAPVFFTEWGYASDEKNIAGYLTWLKNLATTNGSSWTAWVVSPSWGPPMFNADRSLTPFGQDAKDWLAED